MSKLDSICDFILKANNLYDFQIRFGYLISIVVQDFQREILKPNHLLFTSHIFIEKMNNEVNRIIARINNTKLEFCDGIIANNIFILIIREDFPEYYKNYIYQFDTIKN